MSMKSTSVYDRSFLNLTGARPSGMYLLCRGLEDTWSVSCDWNASCTPITHIATFLHQPKTRHTCTRTQPPHIHTQLLIHSYMSTLDSTHWYTTASHIRTVLPTFTNDHYPHSQFTTSRWYVHDHLHWHTYSHTAYLQKTE